MNSKTVALFLVGVAVLSLLRIVMQWRGVARKRPSDWDEQFIQQLRKAGVTPFEDQVVDFFFTVPDTSGSDAIARLLRPEGYAVDARRDAGQWQDQRPCAAHHAPAHTGDAGADGALPGAGRGTWRHL